MQSMTTRMRGPWQDFRQSTLRLQGGVSESIEDNFDRAIAQCMWPNLNNDGSLADCA